MEEAMTRFTKDTTSAGTGEFLLSKADEGQLAFGSPHLFKATASDTAGRLDFIVEELAPMTGPPLHFHEEQDDTFYVLEGLLTVQAGEEILDLGPGDFISIPPGVAHTFDNLHNGDDIVRTINVMTPGGLFPMIEDMARVPSGPEQLDGIKAATRRHGTVIVGPPLCVTLGLE
jgi:mannose-6-phosphate isomerase-like protein (cupin superfamily)